MHANALPAGLGRQPGHNQLPPKLAQPTSLAPYNRMGGTVPQYSFLSGTDNGCRVLTVATRVEDTGKEVRVVLWVSLPCRVNE